MDNEKPFSFGFKISVKDTRMPKDLDAVRLVHLDGRDAFYEITISQLRASAIRTPINKQWRVYFRYGKNGTNGTGDYKDFETIEQARNCFNQKMKDKIKRGYKIEQKT